jgi:hypothetical protein
VHGSIDRRVLKTGLLRMRSHGLLFGSPLGYDTYSLTGDLEVAGEWRRLHDKELHDLYS